MIIKGVVCHQYLVPSCKTTQACGRNPILPSHSRWEFIHTYPLVCRKYHFSQTLRQEYTSLKMVQLIIYTMCLRATVNCTLSSLIVLSMSNLSKIYSISARHAKCCIVWYIMAMLIQPNSLKWSEKMYPKAGITLSQIVPWIVQSWYF